MKQFKIFWNFVPNKTITCDDKDPIWMNEKSKSKKNLIMNYTQEMVEMKLNFQILKILSLNLKIH